MTAWQHIVSHTTATRTTFLRNLEQCQQLQQQYLSGVLARNAETQTGTRFDFATIKTPDQFRAQVPVHSYEDLANDIEQLSRGARDTICAGEILAFEETGGSSGARKLIPYTAQSLQDFQAALFPWLADLLAARPGVTRGCAYWAISPVTRRAMYVEDGTPLGIGDAVYFGELAQHFGALSAVSSNVAGSSDLHDWKHNTLVQLLARKDLSLISVWSPTFLLNLFDDIQQMAASLLSALPELRRHEVEQAIKSTRLDTQRLWPQLDTISCWTHGPSAAFVAQVTELFPHAQLQGKGLLLTEGAVSIPQSAYAWPVLASNSGFYEFVDATGQSHLAHELEVDQVYRLLLTNHSGFYRYDTGDVLKVRGWAGTTPLLEFMGRDGLVSDLCGEKLTEEFVAGCIPAEHGFAMLAPSLKEHPHYILFLDPDYINKSDAIELARITEERLCENPQYRYARQLGQLSALRTCYVHRPLALYAAQGVQTGQRLGDIKPVALRPETDWEQRFAGGIQ